MLERLKSLPLTIILTILIWMYAESQVRQESDEFETVPFSAVYRPAAGEKLLSQTNPTVKVIIATQDIEKLGGVNNIHVVALPLVDVTSLPPDSDQRIQVDYALMETPGGTMPSVTFNPSQGEALVHTRVKLGAP